MERKTPVSQDSMSSGLGSCGGGEWGWGSGQGEGGVRVGKFLAERGWGLQAAGQL